MQGGGKNITRYSEARYSKGPQEARTAQLKPARAGMADHEPN
jgi:hypothetical protein